MSECSREGTTIDQVYDSMNCPGQAAVRELGAVQVPEELPLLEQVVGNLRVKEGGAGLPGGDQ